MSRVRKIARVHATRARAATSLRRIWLACMAFAVTLLLQPAIAQITPQPGAGAQRQSAPATANRWTLFVWMAADNDLEPPGIQDLKEMEIGLPDSGVEVIVFVDRATQNDGRFGAWGGGRLYRIRPNRDPKTFTSELLQDFGAVDSSDPQLLGQQITAAFKRFPAEHYGAVMWNHGGGWSSLALDFDNPRAPGQRTGMRVDQVADAVRAGLAGAGVAKLDLVGFDMCLMGQLETVAEFRDLARVLVASQAIEPGSGWAYDQFLPILANPATTTHQLGKRIVETFDAYNREAKETISTLSAIDLDKSDKLLGAFDGLLVALQPQLPQLWAPVSRSLFWAEQYAKNGRLDDMQNRQGALASIDIVDAVKRARQNAGDGFTAGAALDGFLAAAADATIATMNSSRHTASNGIAIYAPIRPTMLNESYDKIRFARETKWLPFLQALHAQIQTSSKPPEITRFEVVDALTNKPVTKGAFGDNTILRVTMKGENVLFAASRIAEYDLANNRMILNAVGFLLDTETMYERAKGARDVADLLVPIYDAEGAKLAIDAPGVSMIVGAGQNFAQATLNGTTFGDNGLPAIVARALVDLPNAGRVEALVEFDSITLEADNVVAFIPGAGNTVQQRSVRPTPEMELTFLATVFYADGRRDRVPAGPAMRWGDGIRLVLDLPRPGKYRFVASAESIAGTGADTQAEIELAYPEPRILTALATARSRDMASFNGRWLADGIPFFELKQKPGRATLFDVGVLDPELRANFEKQGVTVIARIDQRRLPTLSIFYLGDRGQPLAAEHQIIAIDPATPNTMVVRTFIGTKGDARGQVVTMTREGAAQAVTGQQQPQAPVQPAPMPQAQAQLPQMPQQQMPFPQQAYPQMPQQMLQQQVPFPQQAYPQMPQQPQMQPGGMPAIPPGAMPPQQNQALNNLLDPRMIIGQWRGQSRDGALLLVAFYPNNTYQQQISVGTQMQLNVVGRWQVNGRNLVMMAQSWSPTQYCVAANQCQAINLPQREEMPIEFQNNGYVAITPQAVMQRVQ